MLCPFIALGFSDSGLSKLRTSESRTCLQATQQFMRILNALNLAEATLSSRSVIRLH